MANYTREQRAEKEAAEALKNQPVVMDSIQEEVIDPVINQTVISEPQKSVAFSPEQMELVQRMIAESNKRGSGEALSVYGKRDPRKVESVKVSQFDGKFVLGFKNLQNNMYKSTPKYSIMKPGYEGKARVEPYVTLLLSNDGVNIEEKEVALVDFMDFREKMEFPITFMDKQEVIKDHGILGRQSIQFAGGIDDNGKPLTQTAIKAESKEVIMKFYVQLPGFEKPVEFIEDFLA